MLIVEARILKAKKVTNMKKGKKSDEDERKYPLRKNIVRISQLSGEALGFLSSPIFRDKGLHIFENKLIFSTS